jgi:pyruvate dehydrogenase E2 component (dihydrolipoamide acetyltransferase)
MTASANVSKLMALRASIKQNGKSMGLADITLGDMVCFALAQTLVNFPEVNAVFTGDTVKKYGHVHLAVAVDTPRGLMVPVVRFADCLTLNDLAISIKNNTTACLEGSINPDVLSGGTITVTNIGSFGVEMFTPVLNPPQVAILGVCTITQRAVASENGSLSLAPYMGFSLTIDHRVLDGAPAAKFLKAFCQAIETFDVLLLK